MSKHGTALSAGQFAEFSAAVIKALPRDINSDVALNWANNGAALKKALAKALCPPDEAIEVKAGEFDPATFIGKGWTIAEDRESLPENWDPSKTVLESALKSGENYVTGEEWVKRLADKPLLGASAFWFYWNNKNKIPKEWKGMYVFFDASVLQGPGGHRASLYLCWYGRAWDWSYRWLDDGRGSHYVSASLAS